MKLIDTVSIRSVAITAKGSKSKGFASDNQCQDEFAEMGIANNSVKIPVKTIAKLIFDHCLFKVSPQLQLYLLFK